MKIEIKSIKLLKEDCREDNPILQLTSLSEGRIVRIDFLRDGQKYCYFISVFEDENFYECFLNNIEDEKLTGL